MKTFLNCMGANNFGWISWQIFLYVKVMIVITFVKYSDGIHFELIVPNEAMVIHIINFEKTIGGHMNLLFVLNDERKNFWLS